MNRFKQYNFLKDRLENGCQVKLKSGKTETVKMVIGFEITLKNKETVYLTDITHFKEKVNIQEFVNLNKAHETLTNLLETLDEDKKDSVDSAFCHAFSDKKETYDKIYELQCQLKNWAEKAQTEIQKKSKKYL